MSSMKNFNQAVIAEYRANGGKLSGQMANSSLILLTTSGAKSGQPQTVPLGFTTEDDSIIVIASNAGATDHPDWFINLRANPLVTIERGSERYQAHTVIAEGQERERLRAYIAKPMPYYAEHEQKTSRAIPIVILKRSV